VQYKFVAGDVLLKMFDAMLLKREIITSCNIDVKILETLKDGLVLRVENIESSSSLELMKNFVNQHQLNMLADNKGYFISKQILAPSEPTYLSE
jgi:hypothetical protein